MDLKEISEQTSVPLEHMRKAAVKFAKETSGMLFTARGSNSRLTVPRR
ncbi:Assimilatory nitrate reductase catalytic subunit [Bacillus velezensis]